ncbi:unnamed protein product [Adineta steineri]|uniref:K+ potassium transporter C-terminal domain-containing protein n=1 Tax=Adineta steineri TaxID=433720 RepID=A0A814Y5C5_9BILA|nr:unnamed protein product [Adineta steineri]
MIIKHNENNPYTDLLTFTTHVNEICDREDIIRSFVCKNIYFKNSTKHTPHVFENYLTRTSSVPQVIIFPHILHTKTSTVKDNKRLTVKQYGDSIYHITALYGYSENRIKPFDILLLAHDQCRAPIPDDELKLTLFIPNATIKVSTKGWRSWIRRWPLYLYSILKSIYPGAAVNVKLNPENTINIGILAKL